MALDKAVAILRRGGTAILPTDTVYGIFCRYDCPKAIARIYAAKGRSRSKRLPLVVGNVSQLTALLRISRKIAEKFSRLPVTLKGFPRRRLNRAFVSPDGKIAVRIAGHAVTVRIAKAVGPLAGTSANPSGGEAPTSAKKLRVHADIVVDAGATKFRRPTTIVDVETGEIVRSGAGLASARALLKLIKGRRGSSLWKGKKR